MSKTTAKAIEEQTLILETDRLISSLENDLEDNDSNMSIISKNEVGLLREFYDKNS